MVVFLLCFFEDEWNHFMVRGQGPANSPGVPTARVALRGPEDAAGVPGDHLMTDFWRGEGLRTGAESSGREQTSPLPHLTETVGSAVREKRQWLPQKAVPEPKLPSWSREQDTGVQD